jgi:hypothetical protein
MQTLSYKHRESAHVYVPRHAMPCFSARRDTEAHRSSGGIVQMGVAI